MVTATAPTGLGKSVMAAGILTNYHDLGEGPPLVLLHGSGPGVSAWQNWRAILPKLARGFRVLAPDIAGFGLTENDPSRVYDIKLWVAHLIGFLNALGIERAVLVGNSFGGGLSLAAALRHGSRISRLVLMGTPAGEFVQTEGLRSGWFYEPSLEGMERVLRLFPFDQSVVTSDMIRERYEASAVSGAQEAFRRLIPKPSDSGETIVRGVPEPALATLPHPALVLHGREDAVVPFECGLRLHRNIRNSELHAVGQCGHWVMIEREDAFVRLVAEFAARTEP
jgi:2-hydroxy-6-oxo-octa-2,4-dienoate hydrolase